MKRLRSDILEDQHGPAVLAHEIQRPNRPRGVKMISQAVFVSKTIENNGRWNFGRRKNDNETTPIVTGFATRRSAEDALAVFP